MADQSSVVPPVDAPTPHDVSVSEGTQESTFARVQESLEISKQTVETGAVRVRTVNVETVEKINVDCSTTTANVSRRAVGVRVDAEYDAHLEGDEWVIPVFEYRPVVVMQLFLKEEIRVARRTVTTTSTVSEPVRRQDVIIERKDHEDGDWRKIE